MWKLALINHASRTVLEKKPHAEIPQENTTSMKPTAQQKQDKPHLLIEEFLNSNSIQPKKRNNFLEEKLCTKIRIDCIKCMSKELKARLNIALNA
jgi:hypothetical protein